VQTAADLDRSLQAIVQVTEPQKRSVYALVCTSAFGLLVILILYRLLPPRPEKVRTVGDLEASLGQERPTDLSFTSVPRNVNPRIQSGPFDLASAVPEQVIWPGHDGKTRFSFDEIRSVLFMTTSTTCVVALGKVQAREFQTQVSLSRLSEDSSGGFCWNYHREAYDGSETEVMDSLLLTRFNDRTQMRFVRAVINPGTGQLLPVESLSRSVDVPSTIDGTITLQLVGTPEGQLWANCQPVPDSHQILRCESPSQVKELGLCAASNNIQFSAFRFSTSQ